MKTTNFEEYQKDIAEALARLVREHVVERIWEKDWTLWKSEPREVSNRLGWLSLPESMKMNITPLIGLARNIRREGCTHALLLGMGGSSLAPEVFSSVCRTRRGFLDLSVLDSTDPEAVGHFVRSLRPQKTLFIISSKSGTTAETVSFQNFFWNWAGQSLGGENAGGHFMAITDPQTPLEKEAGRLGFRAVIHGNPEVGGRFSALSPFGLFPAALKGVDIQKVLRTAAEMAARCRNSSDLKANPGAVLGVLLGVLAGRGRDKVTFILSPRLKSLGGWLEQLIAESTGKDGKGILPVDGEPVGPVRVYGRDRVFVHIQFGNDSSRAESLRRLVRAGFPVVEMAVPGSSSLGAQFFLWEYATAVASFLLGINPFDQPNVESTKKNTQEILRVFREKGVFPEAKPSLEEAGISLFSDTSALSLKEGLERFLAQARPADYIAIQAFLPPSAKVSAALQRLRAALRDRTHLATTAGYGPRFLHSTGQLHKGDGGNGLFIQLTSADGRDLAVPDEAGSPRSSLTFGILKAAQARGDYEALKAAGRRMICFHWRGDSRAGYERILSLLE